MKQALLRAHRHILLVTTLSFAVTPIVGYAVAIFFDMVDPMLLLHSRASTIIFSLYTGLILWCFFHFKQFLYPVMEWKQQHPEDTALPEELNLHLKSFSSNYWSFYLIYVLIIPTVHHWFAQHSLDGMLLTSLLQFMLLQLVIAILVGMPGYLDGLSVLGALTRFTGMSSVHFSIRNKLLLVGAYVPMLTTTIMLKYYWWRTEYISVEVLTAWALMGFSAIIITLMAYRSLVQSLKPVQNVLNQTGATRHSDLVKILQPHSNDEIGFLVQTLRRLFQRLDEQDEYVTAIVDHAAEGIIVVNEQGDIEMFNPAAEKLFGYTAHEIQHRNLNWLLPNFILPANPDGETSINEEFEALHQSGRKLFLSVYVSTMRMNDALFFILLVGDITERKATESMLVEAEERYRNLVVTAHDLVWSMDTNGCWTYLNDAVKHIYGYTPDELLYRPLALLQSDATRERDQEAFNNVLNGEEILGYETQHLDKHGRIRFVSYNARPQLDNQGKVIYITGTARDITEQKAFENELTYQAQHDTLTGLYNRNFFQQELEQLISRISRSGADCALLYLDLDQFKYINDTLGHAAGDRLLIECSQLLKEHLREGDLLARFGGDEFTILLYNIDNHAIETVAKNLLRFFDEYRFYDNNQNFNVSCSIGITPLNSHTESAESALSHADIACHMAKAQGRKRFHVYNPDDKSKDGMAADMGWASRVRDAYENNRFCLVYQPIVSVADGLIHDYEVLLRMVLDDGQKMLPGGFIPAAERFGLIHNVDRWSVKNAMYSLSQLHSQDDTIRFAINLSGRAFEDQELLPLIQHILDDTGLEPTALTFEITESAAIANLGAAKVFIAKLKDMGCQFALDDFGTGFCSFAYLKNLPVDKLKIDGSFVQSLDKSKVDRAVVRSMHQVAHALGKQTIAEFVENEATFKLLQDYGIDYAQGNYFSKPIACLHSHETPAATSDVVLTQL